MQMMSKPYIPPLFHALLDNLVFPATAVDERMKVQLKRYEEEVAAAASVGAGTSDFATPR